MSASCIMGNHEWFFLSLVKSRQIRCRVVGVSPLISPVVFPIPYVFLGFTTRLGFPWDLKFLLRQERNNHSRFYDGGSEGGHRTAIKIGHETEGVCVLPTLTLHPLRRHSASCTGDSSSFPFSFAVVRAFRFYGRCVRRACSPFFVFFARSDHQGIMRPYDLLWSRL